MSHVLSVCYGEPADPAAFDEHYSKVHIPLASAIPGLLGYTYSRVRSLDGSPPLYYSVATLRFADVESMNVGMSSPEGQAAAADVPNFASGGATLFAHEEISVRA